MAVVRPTTLALGPLLVLALLLSAGCGSDSGDQPLEPTPAISTANRSFFAALPTGYRLEVLLDGLTTPTSLAATPDGRLLITEQETGRVRVVRDGRLLDEPWFELPVFTALEEDFIAQELGLVTIAVDPLFDENGFVYIYYTEQDDDGSRRTVFGRLRDVDGKGADLTKLVTLDLAPPKRHIAGGIAFDGNDAILLGIGDHDLPELAPRLDSLVGKVLRIDRDGAALPDNPYVGRDDADPRVYASGLRNPFGVTVDHLTGRAYITENRQTAGDAVYELVAGADYGWPGDPVTIREAHVIYDFPMGMAGIIAYDGDALPEFTGDLFYCTFHNGGGLHWSELGPVEGYELALRDRLIAPGCNTGVTAGADGFLYLLTYDGKLMRISR